MMQLQILDGLTGTRYYWGGATDWNREGQWYWAHSLLPVGSFIWHDVEPDGGLNQNHMDFSPERGYKCADVDIDSDLNQLLYPICQKN